MTGSFRRLPRRWQLAILWIPAWGIVMGVICWAALDTPLRLPAGVVVGIIIGISSYIHIIRSGGW